ncbi:MAG: ABC transporter ATP-binding protein [Actinomycetota bacterium]|nr:ABC transporter ATP-binding protein [Euzebyales bacterium]MDQ3529440.1 ABC transporter ATP-binding protein [Actinomycetota bacterium]
MISVEGLVKRFGPIEVLDNIDLAAEAGDVLAVLGPSGCGKSTLLRLLGGFEQPDAGRIRIAGRPVPGPGPDRAMVDQSSTLFPWLSLRDNVAWAPRAAGVADPTAVADRLLDETGLADFAGALPATLSGGMRQRGAIAQVLATGASVLLLDEPFGALDAQTRLTMHVWLRGVLAHAHPTVVIVTHDIDEALLLADRIVVLSVRPARVVARLAVTLGGDRGRSTTTEPAFTELKGRILDLLAPA